MQKYSLSKAVVLLNDVKTEKIDANINLLAGKNIIRAEYIYVPENQKFEVDINDGTEGTLEGSLNFRSKAGTKIYNYYSKT